MRLYAIARICYRPSVRPSVCLSHGWISQKRLKLGWCNFHHWVAHDSSWFKIYNFALQVYNWTFRFRKYRTATDFGRGGWYVLFQRFSRLISECSIVKNYWNRFTSENVIVNNTFSYCCDSRSIVQHTTYGIAGIAVVIMSIYIFTVSNWILLLKPSVLSCSVTKRYITQQKCLKKWIGHFL